MTDATRETIVGAGASWLDGFIEAHPYIVTGLVAITAAATLWYLWKRIRGK